MYLCLFLQISCSSVCRQVCGQHTIDVGANGKTLKPLSRKRNSINFPFEENGISVRSYKSRVRVSVPNCVDNTLVMWVFCQSQSLFDPLTGSLTDSIDMIKFEVTRGLNLKETSHGLLGSFSFDSLCMFQMNTSA